MRRRLAAVVLGLGALLLASVPTSWAAPADWEGSGFTSSATSASGMTPLTAMFVREYDPSVPTLGNRWHIAANLTVTPPEGLPTGCSTAVEGGAFTHLPHQPGNQHTKTGTLVTACNGVYEVASKGRLERQWCGLSGCSGNWVITEEHTVKQSVRVAAPPPDVDATASAGSGRSVVVTWKAPDNLPADFLGYRVQQLAADGWATLADLGPDTKSFTHEDPPAEGGPVEYRVVGRRSGPSGEVTSAGGATSTADVPPTSTPGGPGGPGGPGNPGGPVDPTTPTTGGAGPDLGDLGAPVVGGRQGGSPGGGRASAPRLGITGTFLPPLLKPSASSIRPSTPTTTDDGFDEDLPYDAEPGDDDPVLPDDELAAFFEGENARRGMVIPIATALVLAVWAFHLRMLARMAKPSDDLY